MKKNDALTPFSIEQIFKCVSKPWKYPVRIVIFFGIRQCIYEKIIGS